MPTNKLKIRTGDTVKVISGKDKGKTGKVLSVLPKIFKVVVENVNMRTRFEKSKKTNQPSQKIVFPAPLHASKVMILDANSGQATRVGYKFLESGGKQRIAKASGKAI